MAHRPVGVGSSFTFSAGTATTSTNSFTVQSNVLRVIAESAGAYVKIGVGTPTASNIDYYIPAGGTATLALTKASNRVVGIVTGTTTTIIVPEGTQVPFGVGDYVTLTTSSQPYYDFTHKEVLSVDSTSGVDGYYQTRMSVANNSIGIATAFYSNDATVSISNKISAYGAGSGTLYYQQVQISGQA
jgi:hypothetical protein